MGITIRYSSNVSANLFVRLFVYWYRRNNFQSLTSNFAQNMNVHTSFWVHWATFHKVLWEDFKRQIFRAPKDKKLGWLLINGPKNWYIMIFWAKFWVRLWKSRPINVWHTLSILRQNRIEAWEMRPKADW